MPSPTTAGPRVGEVVKKLENSQLKEECRSTQPVRTASYLLEIKISICNGREIPPLPVYSTDMHAQVCPEKYTSSTITALFIISPK